MSETKGSIQHAAQLTLAVGVFSLGAEASLDVSGNCYETPGL